MPTITLDASGAPKSAIVEGAYEFCGLNGFEYERTPEEMTSGLRKLNALMALLEKRGIDLGYQFPDYGAGLLQEPSGIPDDAVEPVTALLAQRLAPSLGATLSEDARAILSNALSQLMAHYAAAPLAIIPAVIMGGIGVRHIMRRRTVTTSDTTVTPTPVVSAVTPPPPPPPPPPPTLFPPVNSTLPIITGTTQKTQTLSCSTGSWTNSPTSFAYQWQRSGVAIAGATGSAYVITATDVAATITCVVSATNASGTTPQASVVVGPIIDLAPVNTILPTASGTATVGQTLSVTTGTWTNSPTSYGYQWLRGGVAISGGTSSTYLLVSADNGATITCTVTATNSGGVVPATSNGLGPVGTVLPTISAPTLALHTSVGVSPASWDVSGDSTFQPGMYVHQQFAADTGFTTSLVDYYTQVQGSDWEASSESIGNGLVTFVQPTGTYSTRCRFETIPGDTTNNIVSAWSNIITDTLVPSSAAILSATDKSSSITRDTNFQAHVSGDQNASCLIRASIAQSNQKGHFEVRFDNLDTAGTANGTFMAGIIDSATTISGTGTNPGQGTHPGFSIFVTKGSTGTTYFINGSGNSGPALSANPAIGDAFIFDYDYTAHTMHVRYYHASGGAVDNIGTFTLTSVIPSPPYAFAGGYRFTDSTHNDQFTVNFGASSWLVAPDTGYTFYA